MEDAIAVRDEKPRPFSVTRFDVEFTSPFLTDKDKADLSRSIRSIGPGYIDLDLYIDKPHNILPLEAVEKLIGTEDGRTSDVNVGVLDEEGHVMSTVVYKRCVFRTDLKTLLRMDDSLSAFGFAFPKQLRVAFDYEKVSLNQKELV